MPTGDLAFRTQKYLDWEAALARAEAKVGLIPQEAADEIGRVCKVENIDFEAYAKETLTIGYPVLGLAHQIAPPGALLRSTCSGI